MPIIKILNRDYQIACGPGQEAKLYDLADKLDKRIHENAKQFKGANEITLIVLTALMMENSLQDITPSESINNDKIYEDLTKKIAAINQKLK